MDTHDTEVITVDKFCRMGTRRYVPAVWVEFHVDMSVGDRIEYGLPYRRRCMYDSGADVGVALPLSAARNLGVRAEDMSEIEIGSVQGTTRAMSVPIMVTAIRQSGGNILHSPLQSSLVFVNNKHQTNLAGCDLFRNHTVIVDYSTKKFLVI